MKGEPGPGGALPPWSTAGAGAALGAVAALALWQTHYHNNVAVPPRLWVADGPLRERVLPHCSTLLKPFAPTPWAANKHAQTVLGLMRTLTMRNHYNRQLILTVDGATLGLDWFDGCDAAAYRAPASAAAFTHHNHHDSSSNSAGGGGPQRPQQAPTVQSSNSAKDSSFTSNSDGPSTAAAVAPAAAPAVGAPQPAAHSRNDNTSPSTSTHAAAAASTHATATPSQQHNNGTSPSPHHGGGSGALPATAPILLVCHGINGGSHEGYAKWVCAAAVARGWRAVVLNYRGCNGLPFTAPRGYAATLSHDVYTAVYSVRARFPGAPLFAVGYSLGGLKLTKYLGEADVGLHVPPPGAPRLFGGSGLDAAAVVSSPVSLWHSSANLSDRSSLNFMYNLAVAYKLREHLAHHKTEIQALTRFDVDAALAAWTVGDIEDHGLPASFGFTSRQHYYEAAGSLDYIPAITTPTLILLAEDDPFLGVIPDAECSRNPNTLLAVTRRGGHVAFLQGAWPLGKAYMDDAVTEFFDATLRHLHEPQNPARQSGAGAAGAGAAGAGGDARGGRQPGGTAGAGSAAALPPMVVTDAARAAAMAGAAAAAARSCAAAACCSDAAWRSPGAAAAEGSSGSDAAARAKAAAVAAAAEAAKRAEVEAAAAARKAEAAERALAQVRLLMHLQQQQEEQRVLCAMAAADEVNGAEEAQAGKASTQGGHIRSRL